MTKPTKLFLSFLTGCALAGAVCWGVYQDIQETADTTPPAAITIRQGHHAAHEVTIPPLAARLLQNTIGRAVKVTYLPETRYRLPVKY